MVSMGENMKKTRNQEPSPGSPQGSPKLVFSVLISTKKRWQRVRFDLLSIARLDKLLSSLGLEVNQIKEVC